MVTLCRQKVFFLRLATYIDGHCFEHNCMQLKLRDVLSVGNEVKMCRICISNVSCGSGEIMSGASGG